jgi:hypothetical protein
MFPPGPVAQLPDAPGEVYVPTGISPETIFAATGGLRMTVEAEIERLLNFLDQIDGDADLEPAGDELEPDLGSVAGHRDVDQTTWAAGETEADEADDEPSLGSIEDHPNGYHDGSDFGHGRNQERWASGSGDDREGEHDGRGPDVDDELSGDEGEAE